MTCFINKHLFCFGLGYTANHVIKYLKESQDYYWSYTGTKRTLTLVKENSEINIINFYENIYFSENQKFIYLMKRKQNLLIFNFIERHAK